MSMFDFAAYNASPQGRVALAFAHALVEGEYEQARQLLSRALRAKLSADDLKRTYLEMIDYGAGPVIYIDVTYIMDGWPDKLDHDIGWAYVSVAADDFSEGIAVIVCNEDGKARIRDLEWGRP